MLQLHRIKDDYTDVDGFTDYVAMWDDLRPPEQDMVESNEPIEYATFDPEDNKLSKQEQEKQKRREELRKRLNDFSCEFFEELPAAWVGPTRLPYAMRIEYNGHTYEIREVEPKE